MYGGVGEECDGERGAEGGERDVAAFAVFVRSEEDADVGVAEFAAAKGARTADPGARDGARDLGLDARQADVAALVNAPRDAGETRRLVEVDGCEVAAADTELGGDRAEGVAA